MNKKFSDYVWKDGKPKGIKPLSELDSQAGIFYKIVADPYFKRISLEKYQAGNFSATIYDSALFDFRHLKAAEQMAWQKALVQESPDSAMCHIRNQDDRLILIEEYRFEKGVCKECRTFSPQGVLLSIQKMFYKPLNDPINGVILFDTNQHPIMQKLYALEPESLIFTDLIDEKRDMSI